MMIVWYEYNNYSNVMIICLSCLLVNKFMFLVIQNGIQDGHRRIVRFNKLYKLVNFSSVFVCNTIL